VFVHRSELLRNNTVVVEGDAGVLVVDAGVTGDELECLARDIRERGQTVGLGFSTHPDWDHVLWHGALGGAPLSDLFVPMLGGFEGPRDPLTDYLTGLLLLEEAADAASVVVPGHGSAGGDARERIARDRAYVEALRDGREIDDSRIASPEPGWEWVSFIHEGQVDSVARWRESA